MRIYIYKTKWCIISQVQHKYFLIFQNELLLVELEGDVNIVFKTFYSSCLVN